MRLRFLLLLGALSVLAAGQAASASATHSLGFECITGNLAGDCAIGESQLRVELWDAGSGKVAFAFHNSGPEASSITDVYWDDDDLFKFYDILETPGVEFSQGANPSNVPGASNVSPRFRATRGLTADSDSPVQPKGVNPGEMLLIRLKLKTDLTFADVIHDLETGELRIAIHVQGYTSCGSEAFVNTSMSTPPVPEPGTLPLAGVGLIVLGLVRRRRQLTPDRDA
jgi:hypothetical protein